MPPSLIRALPSYPAAPSPAYLPPGTDPNSNVTSSNDEACSGQTISASTKKRADRSAELEDDYTAHSRVKRGSVGSCDYVSQTYGVTTGDLQTITGADDCSFDNPSVCVPLKCDITQVSDNQTWWVQRGLMASLCIFQS